MTSPKPNLVQTMSNDGMQGDREFVFACKSRPFSVMTSPNFPVPAFTMVDLSLVRELNLRMTDLQCTKLTYAGQKLRVLGKISTSVQCILDGRPAGNMHFQASVVQDVYKLFDTHSIAGNKMSKKLIGPPYQLAEPDISTEPNEKPNTQAKPRKKRKKTRNNDDSTSCDSDFSCPDRGKDTTYSTNIANDQESDDDSSSEHEMTYGDKLVAALNAKRALPVEEVTINPLHQAMIDQLGTATASPMEISCQQQLRAVARRRQQLRTTHAACSSIQQSLSTSTRDDPLDAEAEVIGDEEDDDDPQYSSEDLAWRNSPYY